MNNTNLHVYFATWNISGFKKYLETGDIPGLEGGHKDIGDGHNEHGNGSGGRNGKGGKSSSGPKSWSLNSLSHLPKKPDPNVKDGLGRSVLHLVCSSLDPRSYDFLAVLLGHPQLQVNLPDSESGWTGLHRAMWVGNLRTARELLSRADTDLGVKDNEGLTAMDLWNSTCEGTNPEEDAEGTDLFTWGSNKNYTLGLSDPSDRALPERVNLLTTSQATEQPTQSLTRDGRPTAPSNGTTRDFSPAPSNGKGFDSSRFDQVGVKNVVMAKWHTAVVTTEGKGNLSLAGFGASGRLGKTVHSQYALRPHGDLPYTIVSVALGQDHTLALTSGGFVLSWGQNRFSQLGYVIDPPVGGQESVHKAFNTGTTGSEDLFQTTPRRILGPLKKEDVIGVAASRLSSACWTSDSVWTWGTNSGHLGYEKASNPVQVLPRKATAIAQPVVDLALTDYALACLLENHEVLVLHGDAAMKITFPTQRFPSEFMVYRPPAFIARPNITKITSSGITFAALSSLGDVFTFTLPNPIDVEALRDAKGKPYVVKPQMVWALRKRFTAVKDVALGSDGAVIICTHSGHVYVRQRVAKQWSFKRVPFLQRVIKVSANETGSFAAIRSDARPSKLIISGSGLSEDMLDLLPHMQRYSHLRKKMMGIHIDRAMDDEDEEEYDTAVLRDTIVVRGLGQVIVDWNPANEGLTLGCDAYVLSQQRYIPVHAFMLTRRLGPLREVWPHGHNGSTPAIVISDREGVPVLDLSGYNLWSVLLLLQYVYSDDMTAIWDSRVQSSLRAYIPSMQVDIIRVRRELGSLAEIFGLSEWDRPLSVSGKVPMVSTLPAQLLQFHQDAQREGSSARKECDIILKLADKEVYGNSLLLRGRCPFFEAMYGDEAWTSTRRDEDGRGHIVVDLPNIRWRSARMVLKYLHDGAEDNIFDYDHQANLDEFLDFVFEVMAVANELLLDRMVLLCSAVVRRHVAITNAAALACEASFYNALDLKTSIFSYIAASLETMLENGMLDQMDIRVLSDLASFVQDRQGTRLPVSRSNILLEIAVEKYAGWLEMEDIPVPRLRAPRIWKPRSPRLVPVVKAKRVSRQAGSPATASNDDIFAMDDDVPLIAPAVTSGSSMPSGPSSGVGSSPWRSKARESPKTDLRAIMAETSQATAAPLLKTPVKAGSQAQHIPGKLASINLPTPAVAVSPSIAGASRASPTHRPVALPTPSAALPGRPRTPSSSAFPSLAQAQTSPASRLTGSNSGNRGSPRKLSGLTQEVIMNAEAGPSTRRPSVIRPGRAVNLPRKVSEPAWAVPTLSAPIAAPPILSPQSTAMSLLSIQESQTRQNRLAMRDTGPRSLLEIQEQERRDEEALAAEKEFERWWKEEEARVAKEAAQLAKPPKKRNKPRGRGGGGGGAGPGGQLGGRSPTTPNIPTGRFTG